MEALEAIFKGMITLAIVGCIVVASIVGGCSYGLYKVKMRKVAEQARAEGHQEGMEEMQRLAVEAGMGFYTSNPVIFHGQPYFVWTNNATEK